MVIDELVAVLGFDLKNTDDLQKFNRGLDNAAKRAENFSRNMGKLALKAAGVATAMAAAGAAAAKGLVSFVTPVTQKMDELVKASDRLGIGFENLQALGFAAEQSGSNIEGLQASLQAVTRNLSEAARGTGRAKIVLKDYGLSATDAAGKIKGADDFLLELADTFEGLSEQQQVDLAGKLGIDNGLITLLKSGRRGIKELTDQARNLGFVIDEKAARGAEKFNDQMNVLSNIWFGIRNRAALGMVPWMTKFAEDLEAWYRNNAETISDLVESVVEGIGKFATRMREHFNTLSQVYSENADKFWEWAKPVLLLIGILLARRFPFIAAMTAIVLAIDDLLTRLKNGKSVIGDFIDALARFLGTEPQQVADVLTSLGASVAWMAGAAIGVGMFAGAIRKLGFALRWLKPVLGVVGQLTGIKWAAAAAGATAVATAATGAAASTSVAGTAAAGVAGNAASKAPWLPGMRSPLGRLLGPVGTIGSTGFDIKSRMDRLAVLTEQNGGDQVKALEELQRENSLSVYEAADKMTKVLEAIKENTQGLLEKMGLGWMMGGRSGSGYEGSPAHGAAGARSTSAVAGAIEGNTYRGGPYSDEMAAAIKQSAAELGISPEDLATAISYETAGTFDPWKRGPTTRWGTHRGLIQWGEPQRRQYGVTENSTVGEQMKAVTKYLKDRGVKPGHGLLEVYSAINAGGVGPRYYGRSDAHAGGAPGSVRDKVNNQMHAHRAKARRLLAQRERQERQIAESNGSETAQNLAGNLARVEGATAATNATLVREHRAVTQNITVGDVHAAPGERVDRATARAVAGAAAGAGRPQQVARIAAEPAALP